MTQEFVIDHRQGSLTCVALPEALLAADEVRIQVAAFGINRPDLLQRAGLYRPPADASPFLGLEVAGTVIETGSAINPSWLQQKVCALTHGGGYASHCVVKAAHCLPWPNNYSAAEAACLPEALFTVWHNLVERGQLRAGETVLIQAGGSGIGTTAIQIAKALGATVITTAGSDEKCQRLLALGADHALNHRADDHTQQLAALCQQHGLNLVLDILGGHHTNQYLRLASPDARIVTIAVLDGAQANISMAQLMLKRLTLTGSTLRAQSDTEKARIAQVLRDQVLPLIEANALRPVIDSVYLLDQIETAHQRMQSRQHFGKMAITLSE